MKFFRNLFFAFALSLSSVAIFHTTSCTKVPVHPGAVNPVDSQLYDTLLTAQTAIEEAKVQVPTLPKLKEPLNKIIAAYNNVWKDYASYHTALVAGTTTPGQDKLLLTQVQAILSGLQTAITEAKK